MEKSKNLLTKIWLVATVLIVLAGIVMLSIFGFNNTVDYSKGYELTVGVDQKIEGQDLVFQTAEEYFVEKVIAPKNYSKVYLNDGASVVYKFDSAVEIDKIDKVALVSKIENAIDNEFALVSVDFNEISSYKQDNVLNFSLALLITAVVIFVLALILGKFKVSLGILLASIVSLIFYLGMVALFRIPVCDFLSVFTALSFIFGAILSAILLFKFKAITKLSDGKNTACEIAKQGAKSSVLKLVVLCFIVVLSSASLLIFGTTYLKFLALHLLVSSVASISTAIIGGSSYWALSK